MRRATTPTLEIELTDVDMSLVQYASVVIRQGETKITKVPEIKGNVVMVHLDQQETLKFKPDYCHVQVRLKMVDGSASASEIMTIEVKDILNEVVL